MFGVSVAFRDTFTYIAIASKKAVKRSFLRNKQFQGKLSNCTCTVEWLGNVTSRDGRKSVVVGYDCFTVEQERPNASNDKSNMPLAIYFITDFDNRRGGLRMIKLTDWTVQRWSEDGKIYLFFRLQFRIHTLPIKFCNILWYLNW